MNARAYGGPLGHSVSEECQEWKVWGSSSLQGNSEGPSKS